jgi:hypothetical protein
MTTPITSASGTFPYSLGADFQYDHVANDLAAAQAKAQARYDPWYENRHRAAVTVIVQATLAQVNQGVDVTPKPPYHWALQIDGVSAVMMGPSGRVGGDGDPGQLDNNIDSVVVSGYNAANGTRRITHISASQ